MPRVFVTTSWDDEDRTGLKVAELLSRFRLAGTFYVPTGKLGQGTSFTAGDLRALAASGFEIGGHTVSHAILTEVDADERAREIGDCKLTLQEIVGAEIGMFCYPKGRFNRDVMAAVERAGYRGARGTQMLASTLDFDRFAMPTTLQAYPHRRSNYVRNLVRLKAFDVLLKSIPDLINFHDWLRLGQVSFDRTLRNGGVWHLYGHSWEIEKLGLWGQLREMLEYVSGRSGVEYVTNGQLLDCVTGKVAAQGELVHTRP
jgi:peptidoglycan/xylan/chitin deacetylase (PgdA/CDA1 family)